MLDTNIFCIMIVCSGKAKLSACWWCWIQYPRNVPLQEALTVCFWDNCIVVCCMQKKSVDLCKSRLSLAMTLIELPPSISLNGTLYWLMIADWSYVTTYYTLLYWAVPSSACMISQPPFPNSSQRPIHSHRGFLDKWRLYSLLHVPAWLTAPPFPNSCLLRSAVLTLIHWYEWYDSIWFLYLFIIYFLDFLY